MRMQPPTRAPLAAVPRALALAGKTAGGAVPAKSAAQTAELLAAVQRRIQAQKAAQQNLQQPPQPSAQAAQPAAAPANSVPFYLSSDSGASPLVAAAHSSRAAGGKLDAESDPNDPDAPSNVFGMSASQLQAEYDPRFPNDYEAYVTIRDRRRREEKERAGREERERERGFHRDERSEPLPVAIIHSSASPPSAVAAAAVSAGASSPGQQSQWQASQPAMAWQAPPSQPAAAKVDIRASSGEEAFLRRQQMSRQAPVPPMPPQQQQPPMRPAEAAQAYESNKRPRTDGPMGPMGAAPAFVPAAAAAAANSTAVAPSRVVLLLNMVARGDVDEELEGETAEECGKYGRVLKCTVFESPNAPDHEAVRIFVKFESVLSAQAAAAELNGRMFGGRAVKAGFIDESRFNKGQLAP